CLARDWSVAARYTDEGHSGRNIRRPAYQKMMAERDAWDALLVIKMDRIHRNSRNFMEMMENLGEWKKDFVSASESLDTSTAMGRFVMDIIQRIAQLESEQIGERVKMGMTQKARVGPGILGFHPPLGYDIAEGRLVPIATEAQVVREMFDLCLEGRTLEETAADLNANGRRTKRDTAWTPIKVYPILPSVGRRSSCASTVWTGLRGTSSSSGRSTCASGRPEKCFSTILRSRRTRPSGSYASNGT